jgi:hypothetical protein
LSTLPLDIQLLRGEGWNLACILLIKEIAYIQSLEYHLKFKNQSNRKFDTQEGKIYHMKMEVKTFSEICESICRSFS